MWGLDNVSHNNCILTQLVSLKWWTICAGYISNSNKTLQLEPVGSLRIKDLYAGF